MVPDRTATGTTAIERVLRSVGPVNSSMICWLSLISSADAPAASSTAATRRVRRAMPLLHHVDDDEVALPDRVLAKRDAQILGDRRAGPRHGQKRAVADGLFDQTP